MKYIAIFLCVFWNEVLGQVRVELGADVLPINQMFTITITVDNESIRQLDDFPNIPGFVKRGTSSSSSTNFINGNMSSSMSITQNYVATKEGTFVLPAFSLHVNGTKYDFPGKKIKVVAAQQRQPDPYDPFGFDPFQSVFGGRNQSTEFVDVKDDALLAVTVDKNEVYVGEGFHTTISFLVSESNQAQLQFHQLPEQLNSIIKSIKPTTCWEENFNIQNIEKEQIRINNKNYSQYKLYEATFYPTSLKDVVIPKVGLELIKYKVAKNPSFFGQNQMEDFKTFYSKPQRIRVKDLPPHPLKNNVPVGVFNISEEIDKTKVNTGESFLYTFSVTGEGNISHITEPNIPKNDIFDFYTPNKMENITRANGKVTGKYTFSYYAIPKEPGTHAMDTYFSYIFFDTQKKKYDTLHSKTNVLVTGESHKNATILANDVGGFYQNIEAENNDLVSLEKQYQNWYIYILLVLFLGGNVLLYLKK
ncbi:MAG: BatD family protein [Chitinophagaceae bacterium]|nr:BatD family protein [Chitinophagaceae bacterium]